MARDSGAGEQSVIRVLYIKQHDSERFGPLKKLARAEQDYENNGGPGSNKLFLLMHVWGVAKTEKNRF
ncbi:MAG: hypothetical protein Q8O91_05685 [Candidatus Aminicenantes bacterium]|nr:hypothetical protein [Candidatus Aminicenantes bacterium]